MQKRILNVASRAKQDTLPCYTATTVLNQYGGLAFNNTNPAIIDADTPARSYSGLKWALFFPFAIGYDGTGGQHMNTRATQTTYAVGYKETLRYSTSSAFPWYHRRLVFYSKRQAFETDANAAGYTTVPFFVGGAGGPGYQRTFSLQPSAPVNGTSAYFVLQDLFMGTFGKDWVDPMIAKIDTTQVDLVSDTTYKIASGNQSGVIRHRKTYIPMNHNYYYDHEEDGATPEVNLVFHTKDKRGKGNLLIADFFRAHPSATAGTDLLSFAPHATQYWREK